ncbi:MAG: flagellar biosynthesis protein FlhB [Candidatus Wallbacteria bacterium]
MENAVELELEKKNIFNGADSLIFDLQLFADDSPTGQKTEEASPHRREEARKQGQLARSMDLTAMIILLFCFGYIYIFGNYMVSELITYFKMQFVNLNIRFDELYTSKMIIQLSKAFWFTIGPFFICAVVAALGISFFQAGFYFSLEPMMLNLNRFNPVSGLQKMFSAEALFELVKSLIKVSIVIYIPYSFFVNNIGFFPGLLGTEAQLIIPKAGPMAFELSIKIIIALLIISFLDYYYQYYQFEKSIMMSKYDMRKEMEQNEGNPQIKQEIRRRARAMSTRQMMKEVPKAKVVVTNPTHLAIAIRYDEETSTPTVVAKGADLMAQKIREIAAENNIKLHEDKPLAWALYEKVEVGEAIPEEFYNVVAKILALLYRTNPKN